jgi:hypothetical protein
MDKKPRFILYWFVWNGWGRVHGRDAKCCYHCVHFGKALSTEGTCDYCKLHDIQTRSDLVCDEGEWKDSSGSIWDKGDK